MDIVMFNVSPEAVAEMKLKMDAYAYWCLKNGLDQEDDENWNSFSEMMNNR
jgi:hypothetical protein